MIYDEESTKLIKDKYNEVDNIHDQLILQLTRLRSKLAKEKAAEYLMQGVGRRLKILIKCIHNIFRIFPIEKTDILSREDLTDLDINLHAFFVNIAGTLDNLAWVFVYENDLFGNPEEGRIDMHRVGLFKKKTQKHLNSDLNLYLKSDSMQSWYAEYTKNYRDALAHRIPLYVPPAVLTDDETKEYIFLEKQMWDFSSPESISKAQEAHEKINRMGRACPFFVHSHDEGSKPLYIHAQVISDLMTIEEVVSKFCDCCMQ